MTDATQVEQLARQAGQKAAREVQAEQSRRPFTITKFSRHELGYLHARVTPKDGKPVYVHCRFGSWMAPGTINGRSVLKELTMPVKIELQKKAGTLEYQERRAAEAANPQTEETDDAASQGDGAEHEATGETAG